MSYFDDHFKLTNEYPDNNQFSNNLMSVNPQQFVNFQPYPQMMMQSEKKEDSNSSKSSQNHQKTQNSSFNSQSAEYSSSSNEFGGKNGNEPDYLSQQGGSSEQDSYSNGSQVPRIKRGIYQKNYQPVIDNNIIYRYQDDEEEYQQAKKYKRFLNLLSKKINFLRRIQNRQSAARVRSQQKTQSEVLEQQVVLLQQQNSQLLLVNAKLQAENNLLQNQVAFFEKLISSNNLQNSSDLINSHQINQHNSINNQHNQQNCNKNYINNTTNGSILNQANQKHVGFQIMEDSNGQYQNYQANNNNGNTESQPQNYINELPNNSFNNNFSTGSHLLQPINGEPGYVGNGTQNFQSEFQEDCNQIFPPFRVSQNQYGRKHMYFLGLTTIMMCMIILGDDSAFTSVGNKSIVKAFESIRFNATEHSNSIIINSNTTDTFSTHNGTAVIQEFQLSYQDLFMEYQKLVSFKIVIIMILGICYIGYFTYVCYLSFKKKNFRQKVKSQ